MIPPLVEKLGPIRRRNSVCNSEGGVEENGVEFHVTERRSMESLQRNGYICCKQEALEVSGWGGIPTQWWESLSVFFPKGWLLKKESITRRKWPQKGLPWWWYAMQNGAKSCQWHTPDIPESQYQAAPVKGLHLQSWWLDGGSCWVLVIDPECFGRGCKMNDQGTAHVCGMWNWWGWTGYQHLRQGKPCWGVLVYWM